MNIVFLVHHFPVEGLATGGAGNYVANMAQIMSKYGHKVTVITEAKEKKTFYWNGVEIRNICATKGFKDDGKPMKTYKKFLKNISRSIWYNWEVLKVNKEQKVDVVQSVSSYSIPFLRIKKIPYVVRVSEYPPLWSGAIREKFDFECCVKAKRIDESISFIGIRRADCIVMPSYLMQNLILDRVGKKGIVIESPVLLGDIHKSKFEEKDFDTDEYLVTYGALNYRKSIHVMAEVIKEFLKDYPNKKFVLIGRDREIPIKGEFVKVSNYMKDKLGENAHRLVFMGEISDRERLFTIVKNAYACVLPTRVDNLPNTVLEAMALGKIVISSTSKEGTSIEQLIVDGKNGYLADVDDKKMLLDKINVVMKMPVSEKKKIEEAARERVAELTPENVYHKMMNIYSGVL